MKQSNYPPGWDEDKARKALEHYECQSEDDAVAEDDAVYEDSSGTIMEVPKDLVPSVRELIAKHAA